MADFRAPEVEAADLGLAPIAGGAISSCIMVPLLSRGAALGVLTLFAAGRIGRFVADDATWLGEVMNNLLSNALKFTPAGGRVFLSVERDGQDVRLRVRDTGGTVTIASEGPGRGTELTVLLPPAAEPVPRASASSAARPDCQIRRVLVIDDNSDAAESLRDLIALDGHPENTACDGWPPRPLEDLLATASSAR